MSKKVTVNPLFQIGVDVLDRKCLVIGGSHEAEEKCHRLLDAGARITLISEETTDGLKYLINNNRIRFQKRLFRESDLDNTFLVINTMIKKPDQTKEIWKLACERTVLINSFDQPEYSNFGMVALVRSGHLRIGISTSNTSPSLASRVKQDIQNLFSDEFIEFSEGLSRVRQTIRGRIPSRSKRSAFLKKIVRNFEIKGHIVFPKNWRQQIDSILNCDQINCEDETKNCRGCPLSNSHYS